MRKLFRHLTLFLILFLPLFTSKVWADSATIQPSLLHNSGVDTNIDKPLNWGFSIWNPHLQLLNKIKHDKLVAHNKAVEKRRVARLEAARRLAKQKAARRPPVASLGIRPTVYHAPTGCVTGYSTGNAALNQLIAHESGGRSCATNAGGCFGLLQACPGYPLKAACGGDPSCQINWFIRNKTGGRSWETIWALWMRQGYW